MKVFLTMLFCAAASLALGQTGPLTWEQQLDIIRRGKDHALQIQDLLVKDDATIGGDVAITGGISVEHLNSSDDVGIQDDLVVSGQVTVVESVTAADVTVTDDLQVDDDAVISGDLTVTTKLKYHVSQATGSATNGGSITLVAGSLNYVTPVGEPADGTCVVSIVEFAAGDVLVPTFVGVSTSATNSMQFTKTGLYYGPTVVLAPGQFAEVIAVATNRILGN